jgi:hypothetical protein
MKGAPYARSWCDEGVWLHILYYLQDGLEGLIRPGRL